MPRVCSNLPGRRAVAWRRAFAVFAASVLAAGIGVVTLAPPAAAATPRVTVTNEFGKAEADLTYSTKIHVEGNGFQSIQGGFGGVYVLFGWVSDPTGGSWAPSKGGSTGETYRYVPDSEAKDNQGFQRFVSFPGSETEYAANGGLLDASGHWALDMVIPGPTFNAYDRSNNQVQVDCRVSTCGVITVGAHGVTNANNESFTPVKFTDIYGDGAAPATQEQQTTTSTQAPTTSRPPAGTTAHSTTPTKQTSAPTSKSAQGSQIPAAPGSSSGAAGAAALTVDRDTAVFGRVLAFSARGFRPGEQVVVVLDDGLAAVGPISVGPDGSFAAVLALPATVGVGTHVLRATGSAANAKVEAAFPVRADDDPPAAAVAATSGPAAVAVAAPEDGPSTGAWIFLGAAGGVLVLAIVLLIVYLIRRHRPAGGDGVSAEGALI